MGAEVFHGRVRDGIGCVILAMTTGPPCRTLNRQQMRGTGLDVCGWWGRALMRGLVLRAAGGALSGKPWPVRRWKWNSIGRLGPLG